ncbi:hypothetical protein [Microcella sp.]|uniref:hypothetical protein n=1 Tax=Microcella sp. TaxID=1913979 RepID=UPI00299F66FB|nr:hypothetical protein [Microcella sp.]MDX2024741.1 hypothetical protein [Microcella sp.]
MTTVASRPTPYAIIALAGGLFGLLAVQIVGILLSVVGLATGTDSSVLLVPMILVAGWSVAAGALIALAVIAVREGMPRSLPRAALVVLIPMVSLLTTLPWAFTAQLGALPVVGVGLIVVLAVVACLTSSTRAPAGAGHAVQGSPVLGGLLWGFYGLMVAAAVGIVLVTLVRIVLEPEEWAIASRQIVDGSELGFFRGRGGSLGAYVLLTPLFLAAIAWLVFWPALTVTSSRHRTMKLAELQGYGRVRLTVLSIWSGGLFILQIAIALTWQGDPGSWLPAELTGLFLLHQIIAMPLLALTLARVSMTARSGIEAPLGAGRVIGMLALGVVGAAVLVPVLASPLLVW